tara:strand:- start:115 stop:309 length:195 start_codon:yes stop_codon:yes gene_type:complete
MNNFDFNFNIDVSIWGDTLDENIKLIPGNFSQEFKDELRKQIGHKVKIHLYTNNHITKNELEQN